LIHDKWKGLFFIHGVQLPRIIIVDPEINDSKAGMPKSYLEFIIGYNGRQ